MVANAPRMTIPTQLVLGVLMAEPDRDRYGADRYQRTYSNRAEIFDNVYTWWGAPATVNETSSAHTLGIGYAVTGGGWTERASLSETTDMSSSAEIVYTDHEQISNTLGYDHYMAYCSNGLSVHYYEHEVSPDGFDTLKPTLLDKLIDGSENSPYSTCDYYVGSGGKITKTASKNITFSTGVDAPYVSLSSVASYTKSTSVSFELQYASYVCGSNAHWAKADRIAVEPNIHCGAGAARRAGPLC